MNLLRWDKVGTGRWVAWRLGWRFTVRLECDSPRSYCLIRLAPGQDYGETLSGNHRSPLAARRAAEVHASLIVKES